MDDKSKIEIQERIADLLTQASKMINPRIRENGKKIPCVASKADVVATRTIIDAIEARLKYLEE